MVVQQVITASGAFMATNVDDIVVLTLLFSKLPYGGKAIPLVAGQVLGFSVLVGISLVGVAGSQTLPHGLLPLLGFLPIFMGLRSWFQSDQGDAVTEATPHFVESSGVLVSRHPVTELLAMAGLTMVNGSDNISVYFPMFAHADRSAVIVILITFAFALALWLALAWGLTRAPTVAPLLHRHASAVLPAVLIGLGLIIIFSP